MEEILIDIRREHISIKKYFKNKDLVSIKELLDAIEDLILEVDNLEEKIEKN